MSEASTPKSWWEAISAHIAWGACVFTCFLVFIEKVIEQHFGQALSALLLGLGIAAVALHSKTWLERTNPNWAYAGASVLVLAIIVMPFVEQRRWPFLNQIGASNTTAVHAPASSDEIVRATVLFQAKLDDVTKQKDTSIAERDSARRELANIRQELEVARKSTRAPAQQMQANPSDGPLRWEPNLMWGAMGTGHGLLMGFVYFRATNVTTTAVQLKDAFISSGLTGVKLPLKVNIPYLGATPISEINPIPPNASVDLIVEWKEPAALSIKEFLSQWGNIYLRVDYDQTVYERTYDSDYLYQKATSDFPQEGLGPRVTKKNDK